MGKDLLQSILIMLVLTLSFTSAYGRLKMADEQSVLTWCQVVLLYTQI